MLMISVVVVFESPYYFVVAALVLRPTTPQKIIRIRITTRKNNKIVHLVK